MATGEVARAVDRITSFYAEPPRFGTQFTGEGTFSEVTGEKVGRGYNEAFDQLNQGMETPWTDGVWQQALLGRRADIIIPGHQYYWDFPMKGEGEREEQARKRRMQWRRQAPLPVVWFNLAAERTFPAYLSTVDDEVLSWQDVTYLDLIDMFSDDELEGVMPDNTRDMRKEITLATYSNREWLAWAVLAKNKSPQGMGAAPSQDHILRVLEHNLGRCAIRVLPGMTTGRREPPYYWKPVIATARPLIEGADRLLTRAATSARFDAFPLLKEHVNPGQPEDEGDGAKGEVREFMEGDVLTYDAGDPQAGRGREDIEAVFQPAHGDQTRELVLFNLGRAERMHGATEAIEGSAGSSTEPAWSRSFRAELAKGQLRPLTNRVISAAIDLAETLGRAVIAFDEPIVLAKLDDKGQRKGDIILEPDELRRYEPKLQGTYNVQIPANRRADIDLAMKLMIDSVQADVPMSPKLVYEDLMGVENYWTEIYQPWLEMRFMLSEEVKAIQTKDIAEQFEARIAGDEGMSLAEFGQQAGNLPPQIAQLIQQMATARGGQNGATVTPQTQGGLRAGAPLSTPAGGPRPQEEFRPR